MAFKKIKKIVGHEMLLCGVCSIAADTGWYGWRKEPQLRMKQVYFKEIKEKESQKVASHGCWCVADTSNLRVWSNSS